MSNNFEKALKAVSKLTDQNLLAHVAENAKDSAVRMEATDRLTDKNSAQKFMLTSPRMACTANIVAKKR